MTVRARSAGPTVERKGDDLGRNPLAADLDVDHRTRLCVGRCDVRHRDGLAQRRRLGPARDGARPPVAGVDGIAVTCDAAATHDEPDQEPADAVASYLLE